MSTKLTNKEFVKRLKEINPNVLPIEKYVKSTIKIKVSYKDCEHIEYKSPYKLLDGQGCGDFNCRNKRLSETKIEQSRKQNTKRLSDLGIELLEEYSGNRSKSEVLNHNCGHMYSANVSNMLSGSGCPVCHGMKDTDKFKHIIEDKYPNQYKVYGEYVNNREKIKVTHLECGHTWWIAPKSLLRSERCPNCIISKGERHIKRWLEGEGIEFTQQRRFDDCRNQLPLPFDFAVHIKGKLGLIEFDGSQHYKNQSNLWGQDNFNSIKLHDKIKNDYCTKKDIPLLRIPYWWIRNDKADRELNKFVTNLKTSTTIEKIKATD